jgi:hypothetical protein
VWPGGERRRDGWAQGGFAGGRSIKGPTHNFVKIFPGPIRSTPGALRGRSKAASTLPKVWARGLFRGATVTETGASWHCRARGPSRGFCRPGARLKQGWCGGVPSGPPEGRFRELYWRLNENMVAYSGSADLPCGGSSSASTATSALLRNALARAASISPSEASTDGRSIVPSTL